MAFEGFELWVLPTANEYDDGLPLWDILGKDAQIVQFPLRAGRSAKCFSGAMAYMSDGVKMEAKLAGLGKTFGRLVGGGSLFELTFTNPTDKDGYIAFTPDYPGVIVPIHMTTSGKIFANRDSFLCSTMPLGDNQTDVSGAFNPASNAGAMCCAGMDFLVQTVEHGEWAFLMAMGTVIVKNLKDGESMLLDGDAIMCFESTVTLDIRTVGEGCAGNCVACCCSGEGLFNAHLTGPGKVWCQSMSIDKMRKLFPPPTNSDGGGGGGD